MSTIAEARLAIPSSQAWYTELIELQRSQDQRWAEAKDLMATNWALVNNVGERLAESRYAPYAL